MSYDRVVDSAQLDSNLLSIADTIRSKAETSETLLFPDGFISAINNIMTSGGTLAVVAVADASVTVSCDNKSFTKTAGDDGVAVFAGLENGTWSISATSDNITVTDSVDINTSYNVQVKFVTYIYKDGIIYEPISSGFNSSLVSNTGGLLSYYRSVTGYYSGTDSTMATNKIDISEFHYLYVDVSSVTGSVYVGFKDSSLSGYAITNAMLLTSSDSTLCRLDISGLSGSFYFGFASDSSRGIYAVDIRDIYLSNKLEDAVDKPSNSLETVAAG